MKRTMRLSALFCALLLGAWLVCSGTAAWAASPVLDTSTACEGYFTVRYEGDRHGKMKVAVTKDGQTGYYTYQPGEEWAYALTQGDGNYTIRLYKNLSGTKYRSVAKATVAVELEDPLAPYLASTGEITFSQEDQVGQTAQALCQGLEDDGDKALALYRYVAGNFTYDKALGEQAAQGTLVNYVPDTAQTLASKTGILL